MNTIEQRKRANELKDVRTRMSRDDSDTFDMILKRIKDDEDLDTISQGTLENLHKQYVVRKSRQDAEALWKKLTGGKSAGGGNNE